MTLIRCFVSTCAAAVLLSGNLAFAQAPGSDTLYQSLGGQAGISALTNDMVARVNQDPHLGPFFKDINKGYLADQLTDHLCVVAGGPCKYEGASMKDAHADFAIHKRDFNALVEALQASMRAQNIPFGVQNALLARLAPMHRDIITRP